MSRTRRKAARLGDRMAAQLTTAAGLVEAKLRLTPTGVAILLLAGLVYALARQLGSQALYMLTYGGLIVVGLAYALARRKLAVATRRSDLPGRVRTGQTVNVQLGLETKRTLSNVIIEEQLDQELGANVKVPVASVPAGEERLHDYSFTPSRRGIYTVGPLVATWSDPFGLTRRSVVLSKATQIIVHPRTEPAQDRVSAREWEDPPVRPPVTKPWPSGYEFYGMRDYVSGDDPRRIVWRATARTLDLATGTGRYLVRESEQGITDRVTVVLDTDRAAHAPGSPSETFETAVRVVASIATRSVRDGFTVSVFSNTDRLLRPIRSRRDTILLLDELAKVETSRDRLVSGVERILRNQRRDTHMAIVTPSLDAAATARIRLLIDRGISVVLVLVISDATDPVTVHRAGQLGCPAIEVGPATPLESIFRHLATQTVGR